MALNDLSSRFGPFAEELLENRYARENLREGGEKLRDAYGRARKRRVNPSSDRKLRAQFEAAIAALDEGSAALLSGRRKPKHTGRKVLLGLTAVAAAGVGLALAVNEDFRESLFGSAKALGEEIASADEAES
jgi:hypothetical protein